MSWFKFKAGYVIHCKCSFANYLDQFTNLAEYLRSPIIRNQTNFKQTLPISLNISKFDTDLPKAPRNLKDFIYQYNNNTEFFIWMKGLVLQIKLLTKISLLTII